jgi:hypothetical protein
MLWIAVIACQCHRAAEQGTLGQSLGVRVLKCLPCAHVISARVGVKRSSNTAACRTRQHASTTGGVQAAVNRHRRALLGVARARILGGAPPARAPLGLLRGVRRVGASFCSAHAGPKTRTAPDCQPKHRTVRGQAAHASRHIARDQRRLIRAWLLCLSPSARPGAASATDPRVIVRRSTRASCKPRAPRLRQQPWTLRMRPAWRAAACPSKQRLD